MDQILSGINVGVIAGAVVGSLVVVLLLGYGVYKIRSNQYKSPSPQPNQSVVTLRPSLPGSSSTTSFGTFQMADQLVEPIDKNPKSLFGAMNNLSGQNLGIRASSSYKAIDVVEEGEYTMFGDLRLPSLPSQWSVQQVMAWASQNEATPEILGLIERKLVYT
ncbi:hypothetical protein HDU79_011851 [Rhizoclosmatium sp. JEL0117]|nr:hypothetical protein HDU79_011851 [Rhizoclosmatium sp. JEL0117]